MQTITTRETKILIADDEPDVLEFIAYNFQREGYHVIMAKDGIDAINAAQKENPDLMLLDIMMPRLDGYRVAEHVRSLPELKSMLIVFLTALSDEDSELKGFHCGADDYITKPIKPKLLLSRVKALLRRKLGDYNSSDIIEAGALIIDKEKRVVFQNGEELVFARKEFELLSLLASKPGRVYTRQAILNKVWNEDTLTGDRTIDVHVRKIRQKVGEASIKTVKGVGYKFEM